MANGRFRGVTLEALDEVAASDAVEVADLDDASVTVTGDFAATYAVEVSMDGSTWAPHAVLAGTIPSAGAIGFPCKQVRLNCTAYTSGELALSVSGKNSERLG